MKVAALAGRRIDALDARAVRFPLANVPFVRARIKQALERLDVRVLVCSGACGADLLALDAAGELSVRRRLILPFEPPRFRRTSVVDRPGDWGPLFDRTVTELQAAGELAILGLDGEENESYRQTNAKILDEAEQAGRDLGIEVIAFVVWDGQPRGEDDFTQLFARAAAARGLRVIEIPTLEV